MVGTVKTAKLKCLQIIKKENEHLSFILLTHKYAQKSSPFSYLLHLRFPDIFSSFKECGMKRKNNNTPQTDLQKLKDSKTSKFNKKNLVTANDDLQALIKQVRQIQIVKFQELYQLFHKWR